MFNHWKRAALAAVLAVGSMTAATSADARDRWRDRDDDAAIAIGAGVIGLALGAAIASDRDDRYYYDRRYYRSYPRGGYYYYDSYPRNYYYRDYPRYRDNWRHDRRRDWRDDRRYYRRGW